MFACQEDCSRGPSAPENQSVRQTRRKHKEVNDKQMKGRISDTCSRSLPIPLSNAASLSSLPDCLMSSAHGLLLLDGISRCYQSQNLLFFFWILPLCRFPQPVLRMTMTVSPLDVCLALCLTVGAAWLPARHYLPVSPTSELLFHSLHSIYQDIL